MITYQKFSVMTFEEVQKYWEKATNREKCLDMWAAIAESGDGATKWDGATKFDFADFMLQYGLDVEAETADTLCYACVEASPVDFDFNCEEVGCEYADCEYDFDRDCDIGNCKLTEAECNMKQIAGLGAHCLRCPVAWIDKQDPGRCMHTKSPFIVWQRAKTAKKAKAILKKIEETWKK